MFSRRHLMQGIGGAIVLASPGILPRLAAAAGGAPLVSGLPSGEYDTAVLDALPGKKPLIKLSYRPPNYETPITYFDSAVTPNDSFSSAIILLTSPIASMRGAGSCGSVGKLWRRRSN
jgi:hypothetical protein